MILVIDTTDTLKLQGKKYCRIYENVNLPVTDIELAPKIAKRAHKEWTNKEIETLKSLLSSGKTQKEIGAIIGRTGGAVGFRVSLLKKGKT